MPLFSRAPGDGVVYSILRHVRLSGEGRRGKFTGESKVSTKNPNSYHSTLPATGGCYAPSPSTQRAGAQTGSSTAHTRSTALNTARQPVGAGARMLTLHRPPRAPAPPPHQGERSQRPPCQWAAKCYNTSKRRAPATLSWSSAPSGCSRSTPRGACCLQPRGGEGLQPRPSAAGRPAFPSAPNTQRHQAP